MKVTVSFKHMDHTPSLDERIKEKTQKLEKYLGGKTNVKWTCYVKDNLHFAEVTIVGPNFDFHSKAHSDSLYKTIDMALDKTERQLAKKKEKVKNKLHRRKQDLEIFEPEDAWADHDSDWNDQIAS